MELEDDVREDLTLQKLWGQGRDAGAEQPAAPQPSSPSAYLPRGAQLNSKSGLWGFVFMLFLIWETLMGAAVERQRS